jgi:uncharacterized protein (DUF2062 family)
MGASPSITNPHMPDGPKKVRKRRFWRRWLLDPIMRQLTQGVTPAKIALSLAVGSALALFPILGTTTARCTLAGLLLGLNQPILQGLNALCMLIYFPLMVVFVRLGDTLTSARASSLNIPLMVSLFAHQPREFFREFGVTGLHAILGWVAAAPFWMVLIYFLTLPALRSAARRISKG